MRTFKSAVLLGCLTILAVPASAQDSIRWVSDWRIARNRAQAENRLVLLHFWSDTCVPCKRLERNVFNRGDVARAITSVYIPVKINIDQSPQLRQFYKVESVPYDIIVDPNGKVLRRQNSPPDANEYITLLDTAKSQYYAHANPSVAQTQPASLGQRSPQASPVNPGNGFATQPPNSTGTRSSSFRPAANDSLGSATQANGSTIPNSLLGSSSGQSVNPAPQYANPYAGADRATANQQQQQQQQRVQWNRHLNNNQAAAGSGSNAAPSSQSTAQSSPLNSQPTASTRDYSGSTQAATSPSQPFQRPGFNAQAPTQQPLHPSGGGRWQAGQSNQQTPSATRSSQPAPSTNFGLEGFCPVSLVEQSTWTPGNPTWGVNHRGRIYLFANEANKQRFYNNPERYSPVLSGYDAVRYSETGQLVDGKRKHGLYYGNQYFLFADEAALERFRMNPNRYVSVVQQAMRQTMPMAPPR